MGHGPHISSGQGAVREHRSIQVINIYSRKENLHFIYSRKESLYFIYSRKESLHFIYSRKESLHFRVQTAQAPQLEI